MTRVLIIDDEPLACTLIREYLREDDRVEVAGVCHDGFEALKLIPQLQPDLIFLDVQMPKITGFELLELLEPCPAVIFTTAFEEYAIRAFEANAVDYLLKPFSSERLHKALTKYFAQSIPAGLSAMALASSVPTDRIVLRDEGRIRIVPLKDVSCLEADDDYVKIYSTTGTFIKKTSLTEYEQRLTTSGFLRVHRSFLVNLSCITRIEPYEKTSHIAILSDGRRVPVSKAGYARLKEHLGL